MVTTNLMRSRFLAGFLLGFFLILSGAKVCFPAGTGSIPPETVTGRMTAGNGFLWRYGYDIALRGDRVFVHVAINLIPAGDVTRPELDRVKDAWERGIERIWSERFALETPSGQYYPIVIHVTFTGSRFHHDVIVHRGGRNTDQLNWNLLNSLEDAAHEFGHMLGLFDEYRGGATAPQGEVIDSMSIMTGGAKGRATYARHYEGFRAWLVSRTGLSGVSLVPIGTGVGTSAHVGAR